MDFIAHRGNSSHYFESSEAAYRSAVALGVPIETDFHALCDAVLANMHDDDVRRTTFGTARVEDMTSQQFKKLHNQKTGGSPLLFDEVVDIIAGAVPLYAESKIQDRRYGKRQKASSVFAQSIGRRFSPAQVRNGDIKVISFYHDEIEQLQDEMPNLETGISYWGGPGDLLSIKGLARATTFNTDARFLTDKRIETLHKLGKIINVFTVNNFAEADRLRDRGVNGIFTDYPAEFLSRYTLQSSMA